MSDRSYGIHGIADRRYYHFVVVKGRTVSVSSYWKQLSNQWNIRRSPTELQLSTTHFSLEHRKLSLDRSYARGAASILLSEHGKGRPPFLYDLFAGKLQLGKEVYLMLGFPFAALAMDTIDSIISDGYLRNVEFQGVDLSSLLNETNRPLKRYEGLSSKVVGVQFVVTDDKSLTAVRLGGDDPFHAQIYESFLKRKFEEGLWVPDQCTLACERDAITKLRDSTKIPAALIRSRLHIDKSGNFKFYMHSGCSNILLMPYAIAQVHGSGSLMQVFGNPLRRAEQDDGN